MPKYALIIISITLLFLLLGWVAVGTLFSPARSEIGLKPNEYEAVVINATHGWFLSAEAPKACMLLMHSIRSNRRQMLSRAQFLRDAGYSSFLIDLYAHGETQGEAITYGYKEASSARSAVAFLYSVKECPKVVSLGYSLGGAASLLGEEPINVDAYILEAVYPTIEDALRNRLEMHMGIIGQKLSPLLYQQIPLRLGISLASLQPQDAIKNIKSPVLIIHGTEDKHTTLKEAQQLYENAPAPKEFFPMQGAAHVNLYEFDREAYKKIVLEFLEKYIE